MNVPADDKRFLDLLQKWQAGDFTRGDEQELQELTRGDDFRREALEGFLMHPEADHDSRLRALQARLQPREGGRRIVFPQMWAAAAALVLLLTALWFFRQPAPVFQDTMVRNETTPAIENRPLSDAVAPPPVAAAPEGLKNIPAASLPRSAAPATFGALAGSGPEKTVVSESKEFVAVPAPEVSPVTSSAVTEDEAAKPEADLAVQEMSERKEEQAFDDSKADRKKAKAADKASSTQLPGRQDMANAMQTADYEVLALQDYLRRNARLPEAARQNNVSGFVKISFRLDAERKPIDFQTVKSLGYGCDEAAVNLLKAYNWRDFTQDSLTVEIPFVR